MSAEMPSSIPRIVKHPLPMPAVEFKAVLALTVKSDKPIFADELEQHVMGELAREFVSTPDRTSTLTSKVLYETGSGEDAIGRIFSDVRDEVSGLNSDEELARYLGNTVATDIPTILKEYSRIVESRIRRYLLATI